METYSLIRPQNLNTRIKNDVKSKSLVKKTELLRLERVCLRKMYSMKLGAKSVRRVFTISLTTRPVQLVAYIVWPGESESAIQNNQILQPQEKIEQKT